MAKNKVAILVETPLQVMCGYEALKKEHDNADVYIRFTGRGRNDQQLKSVADMLGIEYTAIRLKAFGGVREKIVNILPILKIALKRYEKIYIGSYFSRYMKTLAKICSPSDCICLDDGMATLLAQNDMQAKGLVFPLFTFFNIDALPGQDITCHNFVESRKLIGSGLLSGCYFIGAPLVENGYVDVESYLECIKWVSDRIKGNELIYLPHRVESDDLISKISELKNVSVLMCETNVEIYFLQRKMLPKQVYGFTSTALVTLSLLFKETDFFSLKVEYKGYRSPAHLEEIYSYYNNIERVQVVEV